MAKVIEFRKSTCSPDRGEPAGSQRAGIILMFPKRNFTKLPELEAPRETTLRIMIATEP